MATQTDRTTSVLNLLLDRRHITIDGARYELKNAEEFSLFELERMRRLGARMQELENIQEPTEAQELEYARTLDQVVRVGLIAPTEVIDRLQTGQRSLIVRAFTGLSLPTRLQQTGAKAATPSADGPLTQTSSPRASRGSSAGRRRTG